VPARLLLLVREVAGRLTSPTTLLLAAVLGYVALQRRGGDVPWQVTLVLVALVFGRTLLSFFYRSSERQSSPARRAALVVPFFNETDEGLRRTFGSVVTQSRLPDALFIVNDGSTIGGAEVERWLPALRRVIPEVEYIVFEENRGKRTALVAAIERTDCDVIITTDSDTTLTRDAITEIMRPFASRTVMAVTGRIGVRNRFRNPLTFLQDVVYGIAFLHGRAALSQTGSVLVCSGALAAYRRSAIEPYLDDFIANPWMFGEDRHLTNYALRHGRVVLQESAVARTDVPEGLHHYLRQQVRWQRGFLQQSMWVLKHFPLGSRIFWMTFANAAVWLFLTTMLPFVLTRGPLFLAHGAAAHLLISWAHLARYVGLRGDGRIVFRVALLLVGPALAFIQTLLLTPVRVYALATFQAKGWGSRVRATPRAAVGLR
jgi:hyaluronan synthase